MIDGQPDRRRRRRARRRRPARTRTDRRPRLPAHAGAGQHPPPPLPVDHPRVAPADATLFEWLTDPLPGLGRHRRGDGAPRPPRPPRLAGPRRLHTTTDHHYVFPRDGGDVFGAEIAGRPASRAALPPDPRLDGPRPVAPAGCRPTRWWRTVDAILAATEAAIDALARPVPGRRCCGSRVAPCSPFSVTARADARGRRAGPSHAACACTPTSPRPLDEEEYCREHSAARRSTTSSELGWLGPDVWFAHGVHLDDATIATAGAHRHRRRPLPDVQRPARRRHRPGPRHAGGRRPGRARRGRRRLQRVRPRCSRSCATRCCSPALPAARSALTARQALEMATIGGARVLGRADEIGSLEGGQARRHRPVAAGHARPRRHRRPGRRAGPRRRRRRWQLLLVNGRPGRRATAGRHRRRSTRSPRRAAAAHRR